MEGRGGGGNEGKIGIRNSIACIPACLPDGGSGGGEVEGSAGGVCPEEDKGAASNGVVAATVEAEQGEGGRTEAADGALRERSFVRSATCFLYEARLA